MAVTRAELENLAGTLAELMHPRDRSIVECLTGASQQQRNPELRRALELVTLEVAGGQRLSGALAGYPDLFSADYIDLVREGETESTLEQRLRQFASPTH